MTNIIKHSLFQSYLKVSMVLLAAITLSACGGDSSDSDPAPALPTMNIVETAIDDGRFTTLVTALTAADLVETLSDENATFTVFAPTDDAFAALDADVLDSLLLPENKQMLSDVLTYHVLEGSVDAESAISLDGTSQITVNGKTINLNVVDGSLFINDAEVIITDVKTSNGIIHALDTVLIPKDNIVETAINDGRFNTLVAAVTAADLADTLGNESARFTVFAPTDDAFSALGQDTIDSLLLPENKEMLTDILLYHVISDAEVEAATALTLNGATQVMTNNKKVSFTVNDGNLFINESQVIVTDVMTSNGIIHAIDTVLIPNDKNIVETAVADGRFTTLVAAVTAADLVDTLSNAEASFTVFAPTDDAFDALGEETLNNLLLPENKEMLSDILLYHVIADVAVDAATAISLDGMSQVMANENSVDISIQDGSLFINDAQVIVTNVITTNGIIHAIDTVLIPQADTQ